MPGDGRGLTVSSSVMSWEPTHEVIHGMNIAFKSRFYDYLKTLKHILELLKL